MKKAGRKNPLRLLAVLVFAVGIAGCAARTINIPEIHSVVDSGYTVADVRAAILKAGKQRGWVMKDAGEGKIIATLHTRDHKVDVRIPYSSSSYSIEYVDSQHMRARDGKIHRNYNRWVHNLDNQIQRDLAGF